ncbi:hypothetical protein EVAR_16166_1 [Eumeta japonica]|uniref:Ig-like domain-containing protein n=1 Tax=Eumeta variegata TaxID=151549 RepID=A0A4C1WEA7_EUMVA|nr:hypothetical protein EVAR_16166_1 [Eumeta japonica]
MSHRTRERPAECLASLSHSTMIVFNGKIKNSPVRSVSQPVGLYRGKYEWADAGGAAGGDCSLWVRAATLQLDDGQWQCQVTASNYDVQFPHTAPPLWRRECIASLPLTALVSVFANTPRTPRCLT